jgi:hypothetical protein
MAFGAEYDGLLYAVAYWSNPVSYHVDDGKTLELRRMAVADDAPKNTPSRFLRVMVLMIQRERPDIQKLVSYQDPTYHAGTIYKAAGWINEGARKNNGFDKSKRPWRQRKADVIPGDKVRWAKIMSNPPTPTHATNGEGETDASNSSSVHASEPLPARCGKHLAAQQQAGVGDVLPSS